MEVSIKEDALTKKAKSVISVVALLQGIGMYLLHNALDSGTWPKQDLVATMMIAMFLISVPTSIVITFRENYPTKPYWSWVIAMGGLFLWIAYYSASAASDGDNLFREGFYFIPLCVLLGFISLLFFKAWMFDNRWPPSYESQFGFSWHIFLSFVLAWLFTFIFWLVLQLWGALFRIVDISFFRELFKEEWFLYPVLSLAFAYAVIIFRTKINAVGAVQRILRALISILLPLLLSIATMFVAVLPFTGVSLIWEKGYGSGTIVGFVGLTLFFFNAVYQSGKQVPYNDVLNYGVKHAVLVLNALLALAAYGVWLRVTQYGLTIERILAIILLVLMAGYVLSYSVIILLKRRNWAEYFGKANTSMALLASLIIVLLFTPMLDAARLSVDSQLRRLEAGKVAIQDLDFPYLARSGDYGLSKLELLKQRSDVTQDKKLAERIQDVIDKKGRGYYRNSESFTDERLADLIEIFPKDRSVDQAFWQMLRDRPYLLGRCKAKSCLALALDLNSDGVEEYILFEDSGREQINHYIHRKDHDGHFQRIYVNSRFSMSFQSVRDALNADNFQLVEPTWMDLRIGDKTLNTSSASGQ